MKNTVTQFFKVELFSSPLSVILFLSANILGIILIFMSGFHPLFIWLVLGPIILMWCASISDFKNKVCPHCYGELEVTDENLNIPITQKKITKKCKDCGKEFSSTARLF